jgi:hypothetical protein
VAVIHLDPWTDIVNVHWRSHVVTHVAFEVNAFAGGSALEPDAQYQDIHVGSPPDTDSIARQRYDAVLTVSRWERRLEGAVSTWHAATSATVVVSGFTDTTSATVSGVLLNFPNTRHFEQTFAALQYYLPLGGLRYPSLTGGEIAGGFTPCRPDGGTTVPASRKTSHRPRARACSSTPGRWWVARPTRRRR